MAPNPGHTTRSVRSLAMIALATLTVCLSAMRSLGAGDERLLLTVVDRESGRPIPCRIHLKNARGQTRRVRGQPSWDDHFVVDGSIELELPLGAYTFELERGPEYVTRAGHFTINRYSDDIKEVDLFRFVDMSSFGWWSGDLDIRRPVNEIRLLMQAEDLHVAPLITWWNPAVDEIDRREPGELLVCLEGDRYYHLMAGGHAGAGGTLLYFNLPRPLAIGSADHASMAILEQARQTPEAWVDVRESYAWDLPMLVANRQVDSVQVINSNLCRTKTIQDEGVGKPRDTMFYPGLSGNARWSQAVYFHLLNCGLKIPPSAGSGSGDAPNPVGYNRVYVHVDGQFSHEKWWENFRAGRVVVTNGPLLRPSVHGQMPGHVFQGTPGQPMEFEIGLTLHTREPVSYLEIIKDGQVAHSIRFEQYAESGRLPKVTFDRSGWFLLRVVTDLPDTYRYAMTAPYYVEIGYDPRISRGSAQFFLDWVYERARQINQISEEADRLKALEPHRTARDFWQDLVDRANAE